MKLKKNDLIEHVHSSLSGGFAKEDIKIACEEIFASMSEALKAGDRIETRGFGSFSIRKRIAPTDPRENKGPSHKGTECNSVYFRMSKNLNDRLN